MSIALSVFPILLLIVLMIGFKMRGDRSSILAALSAVLIAIFAVPNVSGFTPPAGYGAGYVGWAFAEGVLKAIFPILIVILMALFSYNVLLESKQIEVIKQQFTNISSDKRIQVLLIVWGFGGLLEGMAGFGTAVAIPAAILIGLGFSPRFSALVSLIGNSVATGFGAGGIKRAVIAAVENIQPTGHQGVINRPHEIHTRKFHRSFIYREYIANNYIARCRCKRASDGARIAHPNFYARRLRNIEPVTHIFGQFGIKLHHGIA